MTASRRAIIRSCLLGGALATLGGLRAGADTLRRIRVGIGPKSIEPSVISILVGEGLGYAQDLGFAIDGLALGSLSNVLIALDKGDLDFGVVAPAFALPLYAKGELPPVVAFYEYTYPYKWDVAVRPGSPIKTYEDLRGKKMGVSNVGTTDYPVTRAVLRNIGIDPDKEVSWQAVGDGVTAGVALERGAIDALAYYDTGFGTIENAGIALVYLPRPANVPMIGGFFLAAKRDFMRQNRALCVAYGRTVAMATEYLLASPAAGAKAFLEMYPGNAPRNLSMAEAVAHTVTAIHRRLPLYRSPYGDKFLGVIHESEWREEAEFNKLVIADVKPLFTNDLIDDINDFDRARVREEAKAVKI